MKIIKIAILISFVVFFFIFIGTTDLKAAFASLQQVGSKFILLMGTTLAAYTCAAIGWKYCMAPEGKQLTIPNLFNIRLIGETVSLLNPTGIIGGEAVKVLLLGGNNISKKGTLSSVLIARILMMATQLSLLACIAVFFIQLPAVQGFRPSIGTIIFIGSMLSLVIIILIIKPTKYLRSYFVKKPLPAPFYKRITNIKQQLVMVKETIATYFLYHKKEMSIASFLFLLHWIIGAMEFYLILKFLGVPVTFANAIFIDMGVVIFKSAGAFVPGQIGVEEYGNKIMLELAGVTGNEVWITVSLLRRLRQLAWILIAVGLYFLIYKKRQQLMVSTDGNTVHKP